jgi:hypothetical protein
MTDGRARGELTAPRRNNYFYGKLMDVWHFQMEQAYLNDKRWLMNRLGLGFGVLCGLQVAGTSDGSRVRVGPGVAVDRFGREIVVPAETQPVDPRQPTDDCGQPAGDPITGAATVTLCLSYLECEADPTPAHVVDCDARDGCMPGTVQERYRLQIRAGTPDAPGLLADEQCAAIFPDDPPEDLDRRGVMCEQLGGACAVPTDACVPLATIELAADGTMGAIDACTFRPVVYSNAMLLDLLLCLAERVDTCCAAATMMLRYVSGDNQATAIDSPVAQPLVAEVLHDGQPVAGETVTFEVTAGGGAVGDDATALQASFPVDSQADGRATLPIWQLGPAPGDNQVRASIAGGSPGEVIFRATGIAQEVELPVIRAIWPPNASHLAEDAQPEWLERWRDTPRLEITFSQEMRPEQLDAPEPWLRLWRLRSLGQNEIEVQPLAIGHAGTTDAPILGEDGITHIYKIDLDPNDSARARYLVQIRAAGNAIQNTANPPLQLDAEFVGSDLRDADLDRIWDIAAREFVEQEIWDRFVDSGATLPQSGDGTEGGRFHSWFQVQLEVG